MRTQKKIYILGAFTLFITAIFSKGFYHFDEHFQILEFAALKLHLTSSDNMPWEYFNKMRPALQPAIVVCIYRLFSLFGNPDPFFIATFTRLLSATLSFFSIVFFIKTFQPQVRSHKLKQLMVVLAFFLWFIIYTDVRFSSENWSGNIFLLSICFSLNTSSIKPRQFFITGCLLGLSFLFRYQTGLLILGFFAWQFFIRKEKLIPLSLMLAAIIGMIGLGAFIDKWFYGEWTCTVWNYFDQNIIQNKAATFGIEPWWYYFLSVVINAIPPFSIIYILSIILFFIFYPKHVLTFTLFPFLLVHCIIGHKELRFLFPLAGYLPFMIVMVADAISEKWHMSKIWLKAVRIFMLGFWIADVALLLVIMIRPSESEIELYDNIYKKYESPAILYYTEKNPYHMVLDIHFYKRPDLEIVKIESLQNIKPVKGKKILFCTKYHENEKIQSSKWQLIYFSLPSWMNKINFNHWQEKGGFWYLYELKAD